jgi:plasmid maintenance system antidote protein VapI
MKTEFLESKGPSAISRVLGISRQTVTNYIRGDSCMTVDHALKLARHYGVSVTEVVDPDYRRQNQDDLITALDAENRVLRFRLQAARDLLVNIDADLRGVIDGIGVSDGERK